MMKGKVPNCKIYIPILIFILGISFYAFLQITNYSPIKTQSKLSSGTSPNGSKVAHIVLNQTAVSITNIADKSVIDLTPNEKGAIFQYFVWSPDSKYLSLYGESSKKIVSYIVEVESGKTVLDLSVDQPDLTNTKYWERGLYQGYVSVIVWRPNSKEISYIKDGELIVADITNNDKTILADGLTIKVILDRLVNYYKPEWSKSGKFVYFFKNSVSDNECFGCQDVYILELNTNKLVRISSSIPDTGKMASQDFELNSDFFKRFGEDLGSTTLVLGKHWNFDLIKGEFLEVVPSDLPTITPTPKPYSNRELTQEEYENYLNIFGIRSIGVPKAYGKPYLNFEWNSAFPLYFDIEKGTSYRADRGRMISLTYSNLQQQFGVNITYSTYDFGAGTEYYSYGKKEDYEFIDENQDQGYKIINVDKKKAYLKYEIIPFFEKKMLRKVVEFPFENYYLAFIYWFDVSYLDNYEPEIDNLYAGIYPKIEEAELKHFDSLVSSIKFN